MSHAHHDAIFEDSSGSHSDLFTSIMKPSLSLLDHFQMSHITNSTINPYFNLTVNQLSSPVSPSPAAQLPQSPSSSNEQMLWYFRLAITTLLAILGVPANLLTVLILARPLALPSHLPPRNTGTAVAAATTASGTRMSTSNTTNCADSLQGEKERSAERETLIVGSRNTCALRENRLSLNSPANDYARTSSFSKASIAPKLSIVGEHGAAPKASQAQYIVHADSLSKVGKKALSERAANMKANMAEVPASSGIMGVRRAPQHVPLSPDALCLIIISTTDVLTLAFLCLYMWFRFLGLFMFAPRVWKFAEFDLNLLISKSKFAKAA